MLQALFPKPQHSPKRGGITPSPIRLIQARWGAAPVRMKIFGEESWAIKESQMEAAFHSIALAKSRPLLQNMEITKFPK